MAIGPNEARGEFNPGLLDRLEKTIDNELRGDKRIIFISLNSTGGRGLHPAEIKSLTERYVNAGWNYIRYGTSNDAGEEFHRFEFN